MKRSDDSFDIIAAQPRAWSILSRSYQADRVASTYLFTGPYGAGHWLLATTFAALLNCEKPVPDTDSSGAGILRPCGTCPPCHTMSSLNFEGFYPVVPLQTYKKESEAIDLINACLDQLREEPLTIIEEDKPASIRIDQARQIKQTLSRRGAEGMTRVVLFDRMEKMRDDSAEALLKLIEEPPPKTVIILTAERPDTLLPTIQSRAQQVRLSRVAENIIAEYLQSVYDAAPETAVRLARLSEGLPGRAIQWLEPGDGDEASTRSIGWFVFKLLFRPSSGEVMQAAMEQLASRGKGEVEQVFALWQSLIRDCQDYAVRADAAQLTNIDFASEITKISRPFASSEVAGSMLVAIKNTLADLRLNVHIQTALAALVLKMRAALRSAVVTAAAS
ncbi:hypothetical protein KQH82_03450 [bacterium]|nr:hypothetical protein [bacterium]